MFAYLPSWTNSEPLLLSTLGGPIGMVIGCIQKGRRGGVGEAERCRGNEARSWRQTDVDGREVYLAEFGYTLKQSIKA